MKRHATQLVVPFIAGIALLAGAAIVHGGATNFPGAAWFPVGEELVYRMKWGFIPIGKTRVYSEWIERAGRHLIAIRYRSLTSGLFDAIYPMNDYAESIIDPADDFRPVSFRFVKARRSLACEDTVTFDYTNHVAHLVSACSGEQRDFPLEDNVRDIVSFMYLMRKQALPPKLDRTYRIMTNTGPVDLRLRTADKPETVKLPVFGKVISLKVEPEADLSDMLVERGEVTMWVSLDDRRMGVALEVDAPLANVHVTLCHVLGPGDDSWIKATREKWGDLPCGVSDDVDSKLYTPAPDE